eukprot:scaffold134_cov170-Skeletonema_menzelii.AAC.1
MFILMFSCGFVFNVGESRKQKQELEDGWDNTDKEQMEIIVKALKSFVKDLRDTFVETEQFGTIGVNSLARILWETWPELSHRYMLVDPTKRLTESTSSLALLVTRKD